MKCSTSSPREVTQMKRLIPLFCLGAALAPSPALAVSLTTAQIGEIYCAGRLSEDMAPVLAILTPELSQLLAGSLSSSDGTTPIPWQSSPDYANTCQAVGASGTFERPEVIIAFGYRDPTKAGYADSLVLKFVDGRLRIDDIRYTTSSTFRQRLTTTEFQ